MIQCLVYAKTKIIILPHTMQIIPIHYFNIFYSKKFIFQLNNINFAFLVHVIDANMTSFSIENNTDKLIYISYNFSFSYIQKLIYSNIEKLHFQNAALAKQMFYNQHKKPWLKNVIGVCYTAYKE